MNKSNLQTVPPGGVMSFSRLPHDEGAFTRFDLATVIAVVALLALLLTPALARSRVSDHAFQCQNNLRQLIRGWQMYASDNTDRLPDAFGWMNGLLDYNGSAHNTNEALIKESLLWPYVNSLAAFKCPADKSLSFGSHGEPRTRTYSMNQQFRVAASNGHANSPPWRIYKQSADMVSPRPADLWVLVEELPDSINDAAFAVKMGLYVWQSMPASFHQGSCSFGYADGHTECHKWKDRRTLSVVIYVSPFPFGIFQFNNSDITWLQARTTTNL